jgi:hypothetical protein
LALLALKNRKGEPALDKEIEAFLAERENENTKAAYRIDIG